MESCYEAERERCGKQRMVTCVGKLITNIMYVTRCERLRLLRRVEIHALGSAYPSAPVWL